MAIKRGRSRPEKGSWKRVGDEDLDNFFGVSASQRNGKEIYDDSR